MFPSGAGRVLVAAALLALAAPAAALAEPVNAAMRCRHRLCEYVTGSGSEHQYIVEAIGKCGVPGGTSEGQRITINHKAGDFFSVECHEFSTLESPAFPRADPELTVISVVVSRCKPPVAGSLVDMLAALNVTLLSSRSKPLGSLSLTSLPREPPLAERHFVGLEDRVLKLKLIATGMHDPVTPERGFLRPLRNLEVLVMQDVKLPAGELDNPPPALRALILHYAGVDRLPDALVNSTALRILAVTSDNALDGIAVPPGLLNLTLQSPATKLQLDMAPALLSLMLSNWVEEWPEPLKHCGNLISLQLTSPAVRKLPDDWLTNCSRLEMLELQYAKNLTSLPAKLLTNASALTLLSFKTCALESLPKGLLNDASRLRKLVLTGNSIQTLPSGLFAVARDVRELNLSSNKLTSAGAAALAPLEHLTELHLASNPRLGDLCGTSSEKSPIRGSTKLTKLILSGTNVSRICDDWRTDMTLLKTLDLKNTGVSELWLDELQFERTVSGAEVLFRNAQVTVVGMTRGHYNKTLYTKTGGSVQFKNLSNLTCDCRMYWTRRALDAGPLPLIAGARCAGDIALEDMKAEDMVCRDNIEPRECAAARLPGACACGWRPDADAGAERLVVRVECAGRGLRRAPRPRTAAEPRRRRYELLLGHNNITELHADLLRDDIARLDLRHNSIKTVNGEMLTKLSSFEGALQLAGNPLDCSCSAVPLLRVLDGRANRTDLDRATCASGVTLHEASRADCLPLATWLACAVAALLALAVGAVVFLASRERRFFVKAVLHRWGCMWYARAEEEDGRRYDAFVTFSHKDEPVVLELIARLEPPYRLCVHYRDWIPGRYITEQIVESVQDSHRTIALVSRHFLNSGWALAEFRQAHAAAMLEAKPRLVVVLLEDPSTLELDEQLRRYLATNTYVRWGDPWFWDKLALALPRPRPPVAAPVQHATGGSGASPTRSAAGPNSTCRPTGASGFPPARSAAGAHVARSPPPPPAASSTLPAHSAHPPPLASSAPMKKVSPSLRDEKPAAQDVTPTTRNVSPSLRDENPAARDVTPTTRNVSPSLRDENPATQDVTPTTRNMSPSFRDKKPVARDALPTARNESLSLRDKKPVARDALPTARNVSPSLRDKKPVARDALPNVLPSLRDEKPATEDIPPTPVSLPARPPASTPSARPPLPASAACPPQRLALAVAT